jgi:hypothetical protein
MHRCPSAIDLHDSGRYEYGMSTPATTRITPSALVRTPAGETARVTVVNITTGVATCAMPARRPNGKRRTIRRESFPVSALVLA